MSVSDSSNTGANYLKNKSDSIQIEPAIIARRETFMAAITNTGIFTELFIDHMLDLSQ